MKSSVFNTLTYQHMVNSNNKLKFYTVQNELTSPSNILELMVASPTNTDLRGSTSVKPTKQLFSTPDSGGGGGGDRGRGDLSPRQVPDWSQILEEYMPRPYNRGKRANVAMPVVLRNKTPFTRLSPEIVPQKRVMETSYLRFLYRTYTLPHNKNTDVLEKLPSGDSPINNSEADDDEYQQQASRNTARFYYELMRGITRLDLQTCINGFLTSLQRLAAIILNMISSVPISRINEHILRTYTFMRRGVGSVRELFSYEAESRRLHQIAYYILVITNRCQRCHCHLRHNPTIADALPPNSVAPYRTRERFLVDRERRMLLLGVD